jgi:outer membrane murein-binding lipoprotein Lpp
MGVALAVLAVAGCADTQPGDQNNGPGYTNNVSDLRVKIAALRGDPCRTQTSQFANCGRFVFEVANTVNTLRAGVHNDTADIDALAAAVHSYQSLSCDSAGNSPSAVQRSTCPAALADIGRDLDALSNALASTPSSR